MALSPGDNLGPYEIIGPLGKGGMGEVWKARDPRLNRYVAIKTSAAHFSDRFAREAKAIAALNHTNICQIYDVGPDFLVMEYIEGTPLKGPLPVDQALKYAVQICDALDAAHKKGITHRDLKPANILATKTGIKLLDFGLAKLSTTAQAPLPPDDATLSMALTGKNEIVGTLYYMSPEQLQSQANGQEIDGRSDIFSFGLVLYEMLTGKRAMDGASPASVIAAIMERPAPSIADVAPAALDRVLKTCLAKDPDDRWQNARDLKRELEWIVNPSSQVDTIAPGVARNRPLPWIAAAALAVVAAVGLAGLHFTEQTAPISHVRFNISPPEGVSSPAVIPRVAISPDGTQVAWNLAKDGKVQMWVRRLDSVEFRPIPGTEGSETPFWSPDSKSLGFFAGGKLKRVNVADGVVQVLCDAPITDSGGTWSPDGSTILFSGRDPNTTVQRVSASGGVATPVAKLGPKEEVQRWPRYLPDGKHFLYLSMGQAPQDSGIYAASIEGGQPKLILGTSTSAEYAAGYLFYRVDESLMARPFDPAKLDFTGEASLVAPFVGALNNGRLAFSVSLNGYLIVSGSSQGGARRLKWMDRGGKPQDAVGPPGTFDGLALSPDGTFLATNQLIQGQRNLWILDLARQVPSRITFDKAFDTAPVWSPDGRTLAFLSLGNSSAGGNIYTRAASGLGENRLLLKTTGGALYPDDWSRDGKYLLYEQRTSNGSRDLYVLPMEGTELGKQGPTAVQATNFNETQGRFSPDGHWIAFTSDESGVPEVNVRSFPGSDRKIQISSGGGSQPRWRKDGKELYYLARDGRLMAVPIPSLSPFEPGTPVVLFQIQTLGNPVIRVGDYVPNADGSRFLVNEPLTAGSEVPLTVIQNWQEMLRKQ